MGVQGRYAIANNLRIAPDVTFYFPKDKITGLAVSVNFHYVFNFKKDGQGFSVYPLAGIGMQNNFYGKKSMEVDGKEIEIDRSNSTKFAFNLESQGCPGGNLSKNLDALKPEDRDVAGV